MKKIYLVKAIGLYAENLTTFIDEVFTNKKLAEAYVKYWNESRIHPYHYWIEVMEICKADYRDLLKVNY